MALPYATHEDFFSRGFETNLTEDQLDMRLASASRFIRGQYKDIDLRIEAKLLDPELVTDIVCQMVDRASPGDLAGYSQIQETAGALSLGGTISNPHGDFYLTKNEKKSLGWGGQKAHSPRLEPPHTAPRWWW